MTHEPPISLWPNPHALGPLTDLYQLTMMAAYHASGRAEDHAVFEMFVRRMPKNRAYLVFAGLEQAVNDLLRLRFSPEQVAAIKRIPAFGQIDPSFFERLYDLKFEGDVWAVPEGTPVFAGEPVLRVHAGLAQAQWVETFLLTSLGYPTLVASKAARVVEAAAGRPVYDFGLRRGQGGHSGMLAARSAYLAGCAGTSNVDAAIRLGIPCTGTMAHSWVQSFDTEEEAFSTFARVFPKNSTLLVDTYDTAKGVARAAAIDPPVIAIRIDSGDLLAEAKQARSILDSLGRPGVKITGSGDLDETSITELVAAGAPYDSFGVGTELITSRDAPALGIVYKLVELNGTGRIKLSPGKKTYPLAKQIYRQRDSSGRFQGDHVTAADERSGGEPLLQRVVAGGKLASSLPGLDAIRQHCRDQLAALPDYLRGLDAKPEYPLSYSDRLEDEARKLGVKS